MLMQPTKMIFLILPFLLRMDGRKSDVEKKYMLQYILHV